VSDLEQEYERLCKTDSDIHAHLPRLRTLTEQYETVIELGVRDVVSTIALIAGHPESMVSYDIKGSDRLEVAARLASQAGVKWEFRLQDTMEVTEFAADMIFIDTLHTEKQLSHELESCARYAKCIVVHDTELYGTAGEDGGTGLDAALGRFLKAHHEDWRIVAHHADCNGLTVLGRVA